MKVKLNVSFTETGESPYFFGSDDSEINKEVQRARMKTGTLSEAELRTFQ